MAQVLLVNVVDAGRGRRGRRIQLVQGRDPNHAFFFLRQNQSGSPILSLLTLAGACLLAGRGRKEEEEKEASCWVGWGRVQLNLEIESWEKTRIKGRK